MMMASSLQQQQSLMCSTFSTWEILPACYALPLLCCNDNGSSCVLVMCISMYDFQSQWRQDFKFLSRVLVGTELYRNHQTSSTELWRHTVGGLWQPDKLIQMGTSHYISYSAPSKKSTFSEILI